MNPYNTLLTQADARANDILRELMRAAKYPWVYRKLNHARWYLLETHTWKSDKRWGDDLR